MFEPKTSAVWIVTRNCTLKCPYCSQFDNSHVDTRTYPEWVYVWNNICPDLLNISGGEPFLLPGFVDMLKALHPSIKFSITTNLTLPVEEFARCIDPKRVVNITCSRHPSMYKQPKEMFDGKVLLLVSKGFHVTVNLVAYPDQMYLIPAMKTHYERLGAHFHVDPYREGGGMTNYQYSQPEKWFLGKYIGKDRKYPENVKYHKAFCSAGQDYIFVEPSGDFWACYHDNAVGKEPRGNVFVDTTIFTHGTVCNDYHACYGCDRDWTHTEVV